MKSKDMILQLCMQEIETEEHINNLVRVRQFFTGSELWPDQCEYAIRVFSGFIKPIQRLNQLLHSNGPSSEKYPNRYSLLVQSHYLEQVLIDLLSRLEMSRGLFRSGLKQDFREYKEIREELDDLFRSYRSLTELVDGIITNTTSRTTYLS